MVTFPMIPGIEINISLLVFLGLMVGVVSGFVGVGGGFLMIPALIILGFPAHLAVGTSSAWVVGNSIIGTLRHRQLGNIDMKLAILMGIGIIGGVEAGVRILNWTRNLGLANEVVLSITILILIIIGTYTFWEARRTKAESAHMSRKKGRLPQDMSPASISARLQQANIPPMIYFAKSKITLSLWIVLAAGFLTGVLAGFVGLGGGLILVPFLVYLLGLPSFMAVGTSIFQVIFSSSWGCIRHTMSGNVVIFAAFILLLGSSVGVQFGILVTRYARGIAMKYILAASMLVAVLGSILKLIDILSEGAIGWLQNGVFAITFGGMGLIVAMIVGLFIAGIRYKSGKQIPKRAESLMVSKD